MLRVEVRDLGHEELDLGAGVAARGMRDNPMSVAVLGGDPRHRLRRLDRMYRAYLPLMKHAPLAARRSGHVVGVVGTAPPGTCTLTLPETIRVALKVRSARPREVSRTMRWLGDWHERDLDEPHWHLGPVAAEAGMRGMGIGSQMMEVFCARMDASGDVAYLETDKPENVAFYEGFGFQAIDDDEVLDTPNWFMRRAPS